MPKITGPADLLGPYDANGERNLFFHDVVITLAARKPIEFHSDGTVTIHDIVDYERLTIDKAIGLYQYSRGTAQVLEFECFIGVPPAQWNQECFLDEATPKRTWADLHKGTNYSYREIDGLNWVFYGAINPAGLSSAQLAAVAARVGDGFQLKTNAQYQRILPAPEPL